MGSPQGIPTLACHGWLDNAASFHGLGPELVGLNLVALDSAGHGKSGHREGGAEYHFVDWVPDLLNTADYLGFKSFGMIGHSMGCGIATLVAGSQPERLKFLVLIDGLAPLTAPASEMPDRVVRRMIATEKLSKKTAPVYSSIEDAIATRKMAGSFINEDVIRPMVERNLKKTDEGYQWTYDPRLKLPSSVRLSDEQVKAFLTKITCPVLIIQASNGLKVYAEEMMSLGKSIKNVKKVEIDGGHHLHLDTPKEVAAIVNDFISNI